MDAAAAAAALCGMNSAVVNEEKGDGCQWPGLSDCLLQLPLSGLSSKLICTNPPSSATEPCLSLLHSDTDSNSYLTGDWSFLITELGTILGTYLAIRSLPISTESVGSPLSRGAVRRNFSRFATRRNEFLWTAASYPR
ncbi:hypothetical protein CDAR_446641 [Caerostris darwini]|uniref:Uncharacterized protein n=1 Tax=Caerostris darwini TaxID=1538125 RepID=A0AAV4PS12_9ARAC|nr:hypothetical protein CDAR_446641 [Caerostris darwini]